MNALSALRLRNVILGPARRLTPRSGFRYASGNPNAGSEATKSSSTTARVRLEGINARLPRFLRRMTTPLLTAPVSHITSFLLLHELTAIIPLLSLFALFHYTRWLPPYMTDGAWVQAGIEKFGKYFRKKGWLGDEGSWRHRRWGKGESGVRIVVEVATAWAVTKALLPLRLGLSVWLTPWFARAAVLPVSRGFGQMVGFGGRIGAAATGAGTAAKKAGIKAGPPKM